MPSTLPATTESFLSELKQGRFLIQKCNHCQSHLFYPRSFCIHCSKDALSWIEPLGTGVVYSTTTVRRKPEAGGDYDVSIIELDEGVRLMSQVLGLDPHEVKIGMRVQLSVVPDPSGQHKVVFHPLGADHVQ
jgi:uncharacterized OB-fold protein